jgi:hypothetical protein
MMKLGLLLKLLVLGGSLASCSWAFLIVLPTTTTTTTAATTTTTAVSGPCSGSVSSCRLLAAPPNKNQEEDVNNNNNKNNNMSRRDLFSASATAAAAATATATATATSAAISMALLSRPPSATAAMMEASTSTTTPEQQQQQQQHQAPLPSVSFGSKWSAIDGLDNFPNANDKDKDKKQLVGFDMSAYQAMRDDPTRTPLFRQAIMDRLALGGADRPPESQVVLDLGTGPFALFAVMAAECGAGKVYAMEANPQVAAAARAFVKKTGYDDIITIVEGFSDKIVQLPNGNSDSNSNGNSDSDNNNDPPIQVDFVIAEIVGSIASEEGAYATIRDAHRFVKHPALDSSWIPSRIQTYAAPASYTLHTLFGPPTFDWTKLDGEPVRFNCRDKGLGLLSDPVMVEDIVFSQIGPRSSSSSTSSSINRKKDFTFTVSADRIHDNYAGFYDEFRKGDKSTKQDAERLATAASHSLSGIACWPLLVLNDSISVLSRGRGDGAYRKSHWQTVLPIISIIAGGGASASGGGASAGRPIGHLKGGETIQITTDFQLSNKVVESPTYSIQGVVNYT